MKLSELLSENAIGMTLAARDKNEAISELVALLVKSAGGAVSRQDDVVKAVWDREELMSTGIGQGVAIPHAKTNAVDKLYTVFGRSPAGIDFAALDQKPVHLFFLLVAPEDQSGPHVKALARISRLLKHAYFRQALIDAKEAAEVMTIIREEELKNA